MNTALTNRTIRRWDEINGIYVEERALSSGPDDRIDAYALTNPMDNNPLKNAEMTLEDDYDSIDGIINNGSKKDTEEELRDEQKSVKEKISEHEEKIKSLSREPERKWKTSLCLDKDMC
ncbi:hypothetical protein UYO_2555 [Lachnospiraceae bacterium JC7]|nr:hypothetical protein UYO_2555 [Lachnospiraceae bacterium JC7]